MGGAAVSTKHAGFVVNMGGATADDVLRLLQQVSNKAEKLGLSSVIGYLPVAKLSKVTLPCLLYWDNEYYVVLRKVKREYYYVADPIKGLIKKYNETLRGKK